MSCERRHASASGGWMVVYTTMAVLVETITESRAKIRRRC
jgi:hypothetical protein